MKTVAIVAIFAAVAALYLSTYPVDFRSENEVKFERFMVEYAKSYSTESELRFRQDVFNANLEKIKILNEQNPQAFFAVNMFADQTESEMHRRMGAIPSAHTNGCDEQSVGTKDPDHDISWVDKMNPVQNQGSCGSCWAFSTTATFETRALISGAVDTLTKFSEQQLVDCTSSSYGCNGGWMHDAFDYLRNKKFCTLQSYPYRAVKSSCQDSKCDDKITKSKGCTIIPTSDKEAGLYRALEDGPVAIALDATTWSFYSSGIVTTCGTGMNHAVVLSGYQALNNAWVIRNSWGTNWGESGYIRLIAGQNMCNLTYRSSIPTFK